MEIDTSEEEDKEFFNLVGCFGSAISLLASQEAIKSSSGLEPGSKLGSSVIKRERVPVEEFLVVLTTDGSKVPPSVEGFVLETA